MRMCIEFLVWLLKQKHAHVFFLLGWLIVFERGYIVTLRPTTFGGSYLVGLRTQTQNAAFFERKGPERKPWPLGKSLNRKKTIAMRFLNASVLERKSLNRNLSWGFPLCNLLLKTRVFKHRVLERKRRPNANASVLGTQRFRTLGAHMNGSRIRLPKFMPISLFRHASPFRGVSAKGIQGTAGNFLSRFTGVYHTTRLDYDINSPRIFWCNAHEIFPKWIPPEFSDVIIT